MLASAGAVSPQADDLGNALLFEGTSTNAVDTPTEEKNGHRD
jgi:hypothetical protein